MSFNHVNVHSCSFTFLNAYKLHTPCLYFLSLFHQQKKKTGLSSMSLTFLNLTGKDVKFQFLVTWLPQCHSAEIMLITTQSNNTSGQHS